MKKNLFLLFTLSCLFVRAQDDPAVNYASKISVSALQKDLGTIAAADMEGRETGTEGQRKAAAYIEKRMQEIGLTNAKGLKGYQQYFPLMGDSLAYCSLFINNQEAAYGKDYIVSAGSIKSGVLKASCLVFAGYGISNSHYDDYAKLNVKGKLVVFFSGGPKPEFIDSRNDSKKMEWYTPGLDDKLTLAARLGAKGALVINATQETFSEKIIENSKGSNLYYDSDVKASRLNYALITHAMAERLLPSFRDSLLKTALARKPMNSSVLMIKTGIRFECKKESKVVYASNVLGILEGSDRKDEYVILTAHYDHLGKRNDKIYYGADDDGSGTVAVLQMAEAFAKAKKEGHGPRRTLVFMTVSGEEKGLWGSQYYSEHPIFPLGKTSANLNTDMVGRIDTERKTPDTLQYVYVIGHDKISNELGKLNTEVNEKYTQLVLDYKFDDPADPNRIFFRSDHYNFARKGVPILFFYDGMLKADYHKPTDTVDKINWELYQKRVQMIFHTAWEVANRDKMMDRDLPIPSMQR